MPIFKYLAADTGLPVDVDVNSADIRLNAYQCTHKSHVMYPCTDPKICAAGHIFNNLRYLMGVY